MGKAWQCKQGQCLLMPSGPGQFKHLFTLVIDPVNMPNTGSKPKVISVGFTSVRGDIPFDNACVVNAGEHPFITHTSYINYRYARVDEAAHLEKLVAEGVFVSKEPCSQALLQKIIAGALSSNRISRDIKELISSAA